MLPTLSSAVKRTIYDIPSTNFVSSVVEIEVTFASLFVESTTTVPVAREFVKVVSVEA